MPPQDVTREPKQECGIGPCKPACLRPCINIKLFTIVLAIIVVFHGAMSTYILAVLTTIEKALQITSAKAGFISSANDIGFLAFVVVASYLGGRMNKPFVIGVSSIVVGVATICSSLPYYIFRDNQDPTPAKISSVVFENMTANVTATPDKDLCYAGRENLSYAALCNEESAIAENTKSTISYAIIIISQVVLGIGVSPIWSLGMSFIDDNLGKHSSPIYIGILFSIRTLSPLVGFGIGAGMTALPVDLKPTDLTQRDPEFIGAWWAGFLLIGIGTIAVSIPMLMFPGKMPDVVENEVELKALDDTDQQSEKSNNPMSMMLSNKGANEKINLKDFPKAVVRLFTNPVFVCQILAACINMFYIIGFYSFMPKYVEKQFGFSASKASMMLGSISALPTCIGTICGGVIVSKLKLSLIKIARLGFISSVLTVCIHASLIGIGCDQAPFNGLSVRDNQMNFTQTCNSHCNCLSSNYDPVCDSDGISYYSACHAGCESAPVNAIYTNCSCIPDGQATKGICIPPCNSFIPFAAVTFCSSLVSTIGLVPGIMLVFRTVAPKDKSLSVGILTFAVSIFGIPSPVMFGAIIDSFCLIHNFCASDVCLVYDIRQFRFKYLGTALVFRVPVLIIVGMIWYVANKYYDSNDKPRSASAVVSEQEERI
ncbi:solute carrier organic anion transporter family member 3A1-like [Tubulanus polymorphus]|uniref:solute carrier organic anion transporter family member 3A1-like n=1 Tax=Tubulanus polymorphus TaxID=672921 RepID=UPI003DA44EB4